MKRYVSSDHESNFWKSKRLLLVMSLLLAAVVLQTIRFMFPATVEEHDLKTVFNVSISGWTFLLHSAPLVLFGAETVVLLFLLSKSIDDVIRFKFKSIIAIACMFIFSISMISIPDSLSPLLNKGGFAFSQADKKMEKRATKDERYDTYESFPLFDAEEFLDKTMDLKYEESDIVGVALIHGKSNEENRIMLATSRHQGNGDVQIAYHVFDIVDDNGLDKYRSVLNDIEYSVSTNYRYNN